MDSEIISIRHCYTDYSNTIIYKISCKDETISDIYIGHTTNFENRKLKHKQRSIKGSTKLYEFIREHGGWDNFEMIILETYTCKNRGHASRLEWFWWNKLGGTLNSISPGMNYIRRDMKRNNIDSISYINYMEFSCRIRGEVPVPSAGLCRPPPNYPRHLPVIYGLT